MMNFKTSTILSLSFSITMAGAASASEQISVVEFAQASPQAVRHAREEGVDMTRISASPGVHILSLDKSPYVGPLAEQIRREIAEEQASGATTVTRAEVGDLRKNSRRNRRSTDFDLTPSARYRSVADIRSQLHYEPISVAGSALEGIPLAEVSTSGGHREGRWTGSTRSWDVPGLGFVELNEYEYKESGGSITLVKEAINVDIHGYPGVLKVSRSDDGMTSLSLGWVTDRSVYRLDLQPLDHQQVQANRDALLAVARALGAAGKR